MFKYINEKKENKGVRFHVNKTKLKYSVKNDILAEKKNLDLSENELSF